MPRFATIEDRALNRGGSAFSIPYTFAAVTVKPVDAANVVVAPTVNPCGLTVVPTPVTNAAPSSSSFASCNRFANSDSRLTQSSATSTENGTKQCALVTVAVGWTSVCELSVAAPASATRAAVIAGDVTPFQVFDPVIDTTLLIARVGFTTEFDVGMMVGSSVTGTGKPPVPERARARCSSLVSGLLQTAFPNARR